MKYPQSIPSTPVKRRPIPECTVYPPTPPISKKIAEGSFYNIYLTVDGTVLRIAKRREPGDLEANILKTVESDYVNKMIKWWNIGGFSYFEMEYCSDGELTTQIEEYKKMMILTTCEHVNGCNRIDNDTNAMDNDTNESIGNESNAMDNDTNDFIGNESNAMDNDTNEAINNDTKDSIDKNIMDNDTLNNDIDKMLKQNTSNIYTDNESESSDLSFTPEEVNIPEWAIKMMANISQALSVVHRKGIIHMDIRPDNILRAGNNYKLCDFNISRFGEGAVDRDGDFMYMPPEVLKNRCYYSSDIYSLGIIYLELSNPAKILPRKGEAHRKIRRNNFKGWKVDSIGRKMLEKDPMKRCTAEELSEYFEKKLNENSCEYK
ncbi:hypothetical protein PAEPH01_1297 [Pancytospora epiphaga]|nr:hypothetical protein PAEPH01_1297 [Pancytospora epiphaga]